MRISCLRRAPKLATLQAIATRDQVASQQSKLQHLYQQAQKTFGGGKQPNSPEDLQAVTQALRESCEPLTRFVHLDKDTKQLKQHLFCIRSRRDPITGAGNASAGEAAAAHNCCL